MNISTSGLNNSGRSRLPRVTKTIPGKLSRLLVNSRAPHIGQKFRSSFFPDSATYENAPSADQAQNAHGTKRESPAPVRRVSGDPASSDNRARRVRLVSA